MRLVSISLVAALAACSPQPASNDSAGPVENSTADAAVAKHPPVDAAGVPQFRPGLWELVQHEADGTSEKSLHCYGDNIGDDARKIFSPEPNPNCQATRGTSAAGLTVKAECAQPGGLKTETEASLSGSAEDFEMQLGIYVIVNGKREGDVSRLKGRRVGECPANMKPGEEAEG